MGCASDKPGVWQKSRSLVKKMYEATSRFPTEEKYSLTSQLRRVSVSASSKIAERSIRVEK